MTCCDILGKLEVILERDTTLDRRKLTIFLNCLYTMEPASTQLVVYFEQVLQEPPTETRILAGKLNTSQANIRVAKGRAKQTMRDRCGGWADNYAADVAQALVRLGGIR